MRQPVWRGPEDPNPPPSGSFTWFHRSTLACLLGNGTGPRLQSRPRETLRPAQSGQLNSSTGHPITRVVVVVVFTRSRPVTRSTPLASRGCSGSCPCAHSTTTEVPSTRRPLSPQSMGRVVLFRLRKFPYIPLSARRHHARREDRGGLFPVYNFHISQRKVFGTRASCRAAPARHLMAPYLLCCLLKYMINQDRQMITSDMHLVLCSSP